MTSQAGGRRVSLRAAAARLRAGASDVPVAGRLSRTRLGWSIRDASGAVPLVDEPRGSSDGEIVCGRLVAGPRGGLGLERVLSLARQSAPPAAAHRTLAARLGILRRRARVVSALRTWFVDAGFVEVDTPARVTCPGLEPHLAAFPAGRGRWLATSPELHLKRVVAAGAERVVEFARAFRDDECGRDHISEFMLLEWYRAYAGLDALVEDLRGLLPRAARAAGCDARDVAGADLTLAPEVISVRDAVRVHTGLDLAELRDADALREAAASIGIAAGAPDGWDDLFFRIFLERVQPRLGRGRFTVLTEFPASQAALARIRPDPEWPVALRFELFVAGVELANAFDELTDPGEQRRRHESDRAARLAAGREAPPLDEDFLDALSSGHPPAAGIALGVDRLVALLLDEEGARAVVPFPDEV